MAEEKKKKKKKQSSKLVKFFKIVAAFALVGLICCIPAYIVVFKVLPDRDPDKQFNRETILQVLSGETRVYYRDGNELLGAFFDANHRLYVPYGDIPKDIVNALVAAEDAGYWTHNGFSLQGFLRAMAANVKSGHMRQGGSTLTQQTAKNVLGREERSIKAKWKELIDALRLERHFSKEDILEFYLNQFHVSGTGKGVAIAAQYFFDKELKDLTLAECAFIAGSVKGPFNYDPFIQRTEERRERAIKRGEERLRYVLGRMVEENYIDQEQMNDALAEPLHFKHGNFRFSVSTTLERIDEKLSSEYYQKLFEEKGIGDWRKAQLEIVTTLDAKSQAAAKRALQNNISNLQMQLGGFVLPKAQFANKAVNARKGDYLYGAVDTVLYNENGSLKALRLGFGQLKGEVGEESLKEFGKQVGKDPAAVLGNQMKKGAILLVSVVDENKVNGFVPCKIETEPVLQGGLVAIQNGKVLASQGGFHNTDFDRSFKALRQLGSSWKPILYALALKHNWNYMNPLENDFNVFQYVNQFYFPRPDHKNKGDVVSIAWAATRSENIASIWLLDHLLDKAQPGGVRRSRGRERLRAAPRRGFEGVLREAARQVRPHHEGGGAPRDRVHESAVQARRTLRGRREVRQGDGREEPALRHLQRRGGEAGEEGREDQGVHRAQLQELLRDTPCPRDAGARPRRLGKAPAARFRETVPELHARRHEAAFRHDRPGEFRNRLPAARIHPLLAGLPPFALDGRICALRARDWD